MERLPGVCPGVVKMCIRDRDYLAPGGKRNFKTKSDAQDAHEAIRPVDVTLTPEDVKPYLAPDQYQVYRLIWARFVASQMAAARFHDTTVTIDNGPVQWLSLIHI